jgi:hypothetical protein
MAGVGFGLYLLSFSTDHLASAEFPGADAFRIWSPPLSVAAVALTGLGVLGTLPQIREHGLQATAALGFAGVLYLAIAYRGRHTRLSYLGLGLLELDWVLILLDQGVDQPQVYAIPAGLYFVLIGFLERRMGRKPFATILEAFGLAVLMVPTFIQSLNGAQGFPYFVILLVEALLVVSWGVSQRRKVPFFAGIGTSVLNVVSQVVVLIDVYDVHRWILLLGVGVMLVSAAVFIERKREQIIAQVQEWREDLETWE